MALVLFLKRVFKLLADRSLVQHAYDGSFCLSYGLSSLQTVVIRLCRNFRDCFGGGLSFRTYEN